ncbi:DUF202 domain-containing protein [Mycolicibacterium goodii]|uniref:DUF202 domain-containing protein n=1 Tax=Mycolicibacterium goodii TaxID=134601 RepID=UPI001F03378F|nr:DUF202 domain-containing protein [Mycolicibacterium goodii]ULN48868.1 DUF202 domain-containing protein [Mycolicibacterium goodii]
MTRQALAEDRGLQAERTALAWTRTALAIAASGVLVLLRDAHILDAPGRIVVVGTVVALAVGVFVLGTHRRRRLLAYPRAAAARIHVRAAGIAIVAEVVLVMTYLALV